MNNSCATVWWKASACMFFVELFCFFLVSDLEQLVVGRCRCSPPDHFLKFVNYVSQIITHWYLWRSILTEFHIGGVTAGVRGGGGGGTKVWRRKMGAKFLANGWWTASFDFPGYGQKKMLANFTTCILPLVRHLNCSFSQKMSHPRWKVFHTG